MVSISSAPRPMPGSVLRRPGRPPAVIAHRGYSAVAPENTLAAFEAARRAGAGWVETDVRVVADGVPVLIHDRSVDRTTLGTGPVAAMTREQVAGLEAGWKFSPAFAGASVPELGELLALLAGDSAVRLLLEIKGGQDAGQVARIVAEVAGSPIAGRVLVQSFDVRVLAAVREAQPTWPLGLLVERFGPDPLAEAKALGAVTYNPEFPEVLAHPGAVAALHAAGVAVMPWTADAPAEWAGLIAAGVDGIITNRPGELAGYLAGQCGAVVV